MGRRGGRNGRGVESVRVNMTRRKREAEAEEDEGRQAFSFLAYLNGPPSGV